MYRAWRGFVAHFSQLRGCMRAQARTALSAFRVSPADFRWGFDYGNSSYYYRLIAIANSSYYYRLIAIANSSYYYRLIANVNSDYNFTNYDFRITNNTYIYIYICII